MKTFDQCVTFRNISYEKHKEANPTAKRRCQYQQSSILEAQ